MKARIFYTKFWSDPYIHSLNHKERNAFIYLFTNELIGLSGVYELPDYRAVADLSVTEREWEEIKVKFMRDRKFAFYKGFVKARNYDRYQQFTGEKNEPAKEKEISLIEKSILKALDDTLSIGYQQSLDTPSNQYTVINNKKSVGGGVGEERQSINYLREMRPEEKERLGKEFTGLDIDLEIRKALNWLKSNGKSKKDYRHFFDNWLIEAKERKGKQKGGGYFDAR